MPEIRTVTKWDGEPIHLNQLIVDDRGRYTDHYVVVDIRDGEIEIADPQFQHTPRTITQEEWSEGELEAMTAKGVPVWGY